MSPRPRTTSDEAILTAAGRAIARRGPSRVTLADVAREAGTTAATLVQRFGSKRRLLLALASAAAEGNKREFAALRTTYSSPAAALLGMADCMSRMTPTPAQISNGLAFLQMDLTDPDFHHLALASGGVMHTEIRRLVSDAVKAGELAGVQVTPLARALEATLHGSMLSWAIARQGTLRSWLRRDLDTVLRPFRERAKRRSRSRPKRQQAAR